MKRFYASILIMAFLLLTGCISQEVKNQAVVNEAACLRMVELIEKGETTRENEQEFIRAIAKAWTAFRDALGLRAGEAP